ncbi:MAG: hypothetical protein SFU53_12055 [Terrimicrobiaceae bacterium]|nr:hypothetical protein [Terrimicrobiaceae bacterium]
MKVHLRQIPQGQTLHLEGEENPGPLGLEEAGATPVSPLRYSLDVGLSDGGLFATGRLEVRVRLRCVATLEDFEKDIVVDPFAMQMELSGGELMDLTPAAREDIHLVLPPHPRRDDGGGSTTRPAAYEGASRASQQGSAGGSSAWDALDKLKPTSH